MVVKGVRIATGTLETPEGALLLMNVGVVKGRQGDLNGELEQYDIVEAKRVYIATGTLETPRGALLSTEEHWTSQRQVGHSRQLMRKFPRR